MHQQTLHPVMLAATQPAYPPVIPSANGFCAGPAMQAPSHSDVRPVLDDLAARFIVNCPAADADAASEELMLLMFEVEKAHWFYVDFWRERNPALPNLGIRDFTTQLFKHCAMLNSFARQADTIVSEWQAYKKGVPTFGACLLNQNLTKVLLVRGWNAKSWGWPKGKVNKDEDDAICAAREVEEEIGYDILPYIDEANTIQAKVGEQRMKLYVIPYVPDNTLFETKTRQEISEIRWHNLADLMDQKKQEGKTTRFYSVAPVLGKLKSWVANHRRSCSQSKTPVRREKEAPVRLTKSAESTPVRSRTTKAQNDSPPRGNKSPPSSPKLSKKDKKAAKARLVETEVDAAGVARDNNVTFGDTYRQIHKAGFSAEEMFKANEEKFGIVSNFSFDQYTTALPGQKTAQTEDKPKGMLYAERFRKCTVADIQSEGEVQASCAAEAKKETGSGFAFKFDTSSIMESLTF